MRQLKKNGTSGKKFARCTFGAFFCGKPGVFLADDRFPAFEGWVNKVAQRVQRVDGNGSDVLYNKAEKQEPQKGGFDNGNAGADYH